MVFVRELLAKWFGYDADVIGFECYNLLNNSFQDTSYALGSIDSENYYMVVNVGNDNSVLSKIRDRMQQLVKLNYQVIIGLRDMFSTQYIKDAQGHKIDAEVTRLHIETTEEQIDSIPEGERISFHFAIMEVEAWLLGMSQYLEHIDNRLTQEFVKAQIGINLEDDPETTLFHPAKKLDDIYGLVGLHYDKHISDVEKIMAALQPDDFKNLALSGRCQTFRTFAESLLGAEFKA